MDVYNLGNRKVNSNAFEDGVTILLRGLPHPGVLRFCTARNNGPNRTTYFPLLNPSKLYQSTRPGSNRKIYINATAPLAPSNGFCTKSL